MSSIFWGLRLEPGKRYSTIVDNSFHVSKAALDCSSVKNDSDIVSVMLEEGESRTSFILCNLQKSKELQSNLDLNFMSGDQVTFFCKGSGVVHLSGYIILEDEDELGGLGEEEEVDEEEGGEDDVEGVLKQMNGTAQKRKKALASKPNSKKPKLNEDDDDEEDSDDDEEDDEDDDDDDAANDMNLSGLVGSDEDEDESDEDDDDEEEEEESDEEEEEEEEKYEPPKPLLNNKQKNKGKGQQNQTTAPGSKQGTPMGEKQKTPKGQQKTPNQEQQLSGKKDKKKGDTPKAQNKSMSEEVVSSPKLAPKTVQGGVIVKDVKVGNGPVCKNGKMVSVYYTGRLKSNNKVFDSTTQGSGFQFRLGKGEVIKGWDVGLQGMKVGGKRVITCPPQMAYGQKGSPPTIPGNSTLTFEVELRAIH